MSEWRYSANDIKALYTEALGKPVAAKAWLDLNLFSLEEGMASWRMQILRGRREAMGLSMAELAEKIGATKATVYDVEKGRTDFFGREHAEGWLAALGIPALLVRAAELMDAHEGMDSPTAMLVVALIDGQEVMW